MVDEETRERVRRMRARRAERLAGREPGGEEVQIPARSGMRRSIVYRPDGAQSPLPVYFDVHGGGFVQGEPGGPFCERVSEELGIVVVSPSYRLAPEHMFPADKEDVFDVIRHVHDHAADYGIDPGRMAVGGHSAGGNIATVVAMLAKETGAFGLRCVVVDYAPCDLSTDAHDKPLPRGCIDPDVAAMFDACYRDPEDGRDPHLSPVYATQAQLRGLPPHLVITAQGDSLCFEAEEYAKHLVQAGVETTARRFLGVAHGFTMSGRPMGPDTREQAARSTAEARELIVSTLARYLL